MTHYKLRNKVKAGPCNAVTSDIFQHVPIVIWRFYRPKVRGSWVIRALKSSISRYKSLLFGAWIAIYRATWCTFKSKRGKKFFIKNFLIFFQKKFSYTVREMELSYIFPKKFFLIFQEIELSRPKLKKLIFFLKIFSYISGGNL